MAKKVYKRKKSKSPTKITCMRVTDLGVKWNIPSKEINKLVDEHLTPRKHFRLHNKPSYRTIFRAGLEIVEPLIKDMLAPEAPPEPKSEPIQILPMPDSKWDDGMEMMDYETFKTIFHPKPVPKQEKEPDEEDYEDGDIIHVRIVGDPQRGKPMNTRLVWVEVNGERCRCVVSSLKRKGMKAKQLIRVRCEDKETGLFKHV